MVKKVWLVCGVTVAVLGALLLYKFHALGHKTQGPAVMVSAVPIGGSFTLTDENGAAVTDQDFAGTQKLIFFGFTHCPAICPAELLKISDILTALGDGAKNMTPLFVTVDPVRDTAPVMKTYTDQFDPRIIGLTGTQDQIDQVVKKFRVYAARVPQGDDYTMDHSAFLYLTDANNIMITMYKMDQSADDIARDIKSRR